MMILEQVWDYDFDPGSNIIDVYIRKLREKIDAGEAFDLAVLTPEATADLAKQGKVMAGTNAEIARVGIGFQLAGNGFECAQTFDHFFIRSSSASVKRTDTMYGSSSFVQCP